MLKYVSDYRVILFVLGLLPSVIVNLSTNYHHHSLDAADEPATDLSRILPGEGNKEYQVESPLLPNNHREEQASNGLEQTARPTSMDIDHRYQLIGVSQKNALHEDFVTKATKTDQSKKAKGQRWIEKMYGKSSKKRKVADQDFLPKKLTMGYEAKDQLLMDDNYRDVGKKPLHDNKLTVDGLRSGYYFDSYGDWHHNGGDHASTSGTWTNGLTDIGGGYFGGGGGGSGGVSNGHSQGNGFHLAGWHLLNPLILVATLSFVISLINALLGLADKVKLSLARGRRTGPPEYSRGVDEEFLDELGKLYDSIQYGQKRL